MNRIYRGIVSQKTRQFIERLYTVSMNKGNAQLILILAFALTLWGCSTGTSPTRVKSDCLYIGCETGGVTVYPHEEFSATRLPRRWYGIDGNLPSDYPPGSEQRRKLRTQQIQKLRSMGLDSQGRPLTE